MQSHLLSRGVRLEELLIKLISDYDSRMNWDGESVRSTKKKWT